ncbi:hypothetical protein [Lactiplantibacillus paraxiangfangensis]|uniref:hypothetical protein n=1 Tax=Lactiplantibacillus paraxiangfangensis TaxID=3076224 RepID=UPI0030C710D0
MHIVSEHTELWEFGPTTISRHYCTVRQKIVGYSNESTVFPTEHDARRFFQTLITDHRESFFEAVELETHCSNPEFLEELYGIGLRTAHQYQEQLLDKE